MAGEIRAIGPSGRTCYVHIFNSSGQRWNGSEFEAFASGNYANYDVSTSEDGATGIYRGDFPSGITAGRYDVVLFIQAGASPVNGDKPAGAQSIQWSGSSTTPATTPLGSLTGSEMLAYIRRSGFRRTDMDTEVYEAMTDAVMEMEQLFRFDEREKEQTTTDEISTLGDYQINYESDYGRIISVVLIDGTFSKPLHKISKEVYDLMYPSPTTDTDRGYPEHFALFGGQILIGPAPDSTDYEYRKAYSQRLTDTIDANTDPVPFSAQYREILKDGVLRRLWQNLKKFDLSDQFAEYFNQGMRRAAKLERDNRGAPGFVAYNDC